jgi:hypothetical protein
MVVKNNPKALGEEKIKRRPGEGNFKARPEVSYKHNVNAA